MQEAPSQTLGAAQRIALPNGTALPGPHWDQGSAEDRTLLWDAWLSPAPIFTWADSLLPRAAMRPRISLNGMGPIGRHWGLGWAIRFCVWQSTAKTYMSEA